MNIENWNVAQEKIGENQNYDGGSRNVMIVQPDWKSLHEQNKYERELESIEQKIKLREAERERKKAVIDVLTIDDRGEISIETKNTWNTYPNRNVANFTKPSLKILMNEITGEKKFLLTITLNEKQRNIWIDEAECGNAKIILEKLNAIGAEFYSRKQSEKKAFVTQLWSILYRNNPEILILADAPGWKKDRDGKLRFEEEEKATWWAIKKMQ